jgi:hypothetical protein
MPFEVVPFLCGALLCWWRRIGNWTIAIAAVLIGTACAAIAGELALPAPLPLLAIGVDTLAAAAGCVAARLVIRIVSQSGRG